MIQVSKYYEKTFTKRSDVTKIVKKNSLCNGCGFDLGDYYKYASVNNNVFMRENNGKNIIFCKLCNIVCNLNYNVDYVSIYKSDLTQKEIIIKTNEFYEKNKFIPDIYCVDSNAKKINCLSPFELSVLIRIDGSKEKLSNFRLFFNKNCSIEYIDNKNNVNNHYVDFSDSDSNSELLESESEKGFSSPDSESNNIDNYSLTNKERNKLEKLFY